MYTVWILIYIFLYKSLIYIHLFVKRAMNKKYVLITIQLHSNLRERVFNEQLPEGCTDSRVARTRYSKVSNLNKHYCQKHYCIQDIIARMQRHNDDRYGYEDNMQYGLLLGLYWYNTMWHKWCSSLVQQNVT